MMKEYLVKAKEFYEAHERKLNITGLLTGFLVDMFIFQQTNLRTESIVLAVYLALGALGITIINLYEGGRLQYSFFHKARLWLPLIVQYSFGGSFSAFIILYLKSTSLLASWPFFAIIATIAIGNEFFRKHYIRLTFHMAIYFLAVFSYSVFYLPLVFNRVGVEVFVTGSVVSVVVISAFIGFLSKLIPARINRAKDALVFTIGGVFTLMYIFYFSNVIPPIPLAMNAGGVFHDVDRQIVNYEVQYEPPVWYETFLPYRTLHIRPGDPVYVFTSIFAPANLDITVRHHWQFFDTGQDKWVSRSKIKYPVTGGRGQGYRGFSVKENVESGRWRVDIETPTGQVIGRIPFIIEYSGTKPELKTRVF